MPVGSALRVKGLPAQLLQALIILPEPLGPEPAQHGENDKAKFVEACRSLEFQVNQVHDGPGHAAAIAFYAGQQLAEAQRLPLVEVVGR